LSRHGAEGAKTAGTTLATGAGKEHSMNADHAKPAANGHDSAATLPTPNWYEGVQIEACSPLDRLVVETRNSSYDVVVVSPKDGEVLVRGGRLFPDFRQGQLVGATSGGHTVKLRGIYVGLCLELFVDRRCVTTSPVAAVYRAAACASETSAASS
jgi:hypothetical protein